MAVALVFAAAFSYLMYLAESTLSGITFVAVYFISEILIAIIDEFFFVKNSMVTELSAIQLENRRRVLDLLDSLKIPYEVLTTLTHREPYLVVKALDLNLYLYFDGEAGVQSENRRTDLRLELADFENDPHELANQLVKELDSLLKLS